MESSATSPLRHLFSSEGDVFTFRGPGPDGLVYQGMLHKPEGPGPFPAVVISHPHSLYGGSMDVPLVRNLGEELAARGICALRFNFRGVGNSEGASTGGEGEMVDLLGALETIIHLPGIVPERVGVAGYSFGAWIGMLVAACNEVPIRALVAISLPLWLANPDWHPAVTCPMLFLNGDADYLCPLSDLQAFLGDNQPSAQMCIISGTDHFFCHHEAEVARVVANFLAEHL